MIARKPADDCKRLHVIDDEIIRQPLQKGENFLLTATEHWEVGDRGPFQPWAAPVSISISSQSRPAHVNPSSAPIVEARSGRLEKNFLLPEVLRDHVI